MGLWGNFGTAAMIVARSLGTHWKLVGNALGGRWELMCLPNTGDTNTPSDFIKQKYIVIQYGKCTHNVLQ